MLPSSTVENYLKAIYQGAGALTPPQRLLPMGQLASALGVVPGTATTMVKALAESGLVEYEPYSGVALTPAGHKLAALVLRRHRLVELFLVRVMGYAWDEVHDEAEQLEHVVSDRLIDRMDEMLGRPEVDPHGDPIPDCRGPGEDAGGAEPDDLPDWRAGHGDARRRSGQRLPALRRAPPPQARRRDPGRGARRVGRQRARARRGRSADHDRHARRVEAAGAGGPDGACSCCSRWRPRWRRTRRRRQARGAAHESLGLHGLPLQQARVRRRRRSTSTASCCWSRTRSAIASAS